MPLTLRKMPPLGIGIIITPAAAPVQGWAAPTPEPSKRRLSPAVLAGSAVLAIAAFAGAAMYLTRECTGLSLVKIGEIFGGRDHTTVLLGINKVTEEMRARDAVFRQVQDLTRIIRARARGAA